MKHQVEKMSTLKAMITVNFSYKVVALFVALILWLSILGRRDFVGTKEIDVNFIVGQHLTVASQSADRLKVKISGSQPLLKKYKDKPQTLVFDVSDRGAGVYDVEIANSRIDTAEGVKVLSVRPNVIKVEIVEDGK